MVHYKLTYKQGRGLAEVSRQLFVIAKVDFEDNRITDEQLAQIKNKIPFGQLPILEEDGKMLAQSKAIARYLARKFGFAGKNTWEEAQADALADQWTDFMLEVRPFHVVSYGFLPGDVKKLEKEVFEPAVHKHFPLFVKALKKNGTGFLVGNSLTYADLPVADYIAILDKKTPQLIDPYPELRSHYKKVHSNPELKSWLETRPKTKF